jgi:hypothetical protein
LRSTSIRNDKNEAPDTPCQDGWVIEIGPTGRQAAATVSERRGWPVECVQDMQNALEFLRNRSGYALAVLDLTKASTEAFLAAAQAVAENAPDLALGFLYGRGAEQLYEAALRLPSAPQRARQGKRQVIYEGEGFTRWVEGAELLHAAAGAPSAEEIQALLADKAAAAFLVGHGDGIGFGFPASSLCRRDTADIDRADTRMHPCFHGAPCFRGNGRHTSADSVGAQRVLLMSCFGVRIPSIHYAPEYSLGEALMRYACVESLLTSIRVAIIRPHDVALAYYLLNTGLPMGVVANRINRFRLLAGQQAEFICFGDPASCLSSTVSLCSEGWNTRQSAATIQGRDLAPGLHDLCIPIPLSTVEQDVVMIASGPAAVKTAIFDRSGPPAMMPNAIGSSEGPTGTLYVTVEMTGRGQEATIHLTPRGDTLILEALPQRILEDLQFLKIYVAGSRMMGHESDLEKELALQIDGLIHMLQVWPIAALPDGAWLAQETLTKLKNQLDILLQDLARLVGTHFEQVVREKGAHIMRAFWQKAFTLDREKPNVSSCAYCGEPVDCITQSTRISSGLERCQLYCSACGPVCDGDPAMVKWIAAPPEVQAGDSVEARLVVENVYGLALPVNVRIAFEDCSRRRTSVSPLKSGRLETEGGIMELELAVPEKVTPGVHRASAMVMVGAKINFLFRLVRVN